MFILHVCCRRVFWSNHALQHKVLTYVEYTTELCLASSELLTPHPPLHPASVSSPRTKGGRVHTRRAVGGGGGGGSIFWKMPDIGLASYSIISLRPAVFCHIYFDRCLVHTHVVFVQVSRLLVCWRQRVGIVQLENKIIRSMRREVITVRGQSNVWRLPPPSPPGVCVLPTPTPPTKAGGTHTRRAERDGGGSIFWKTRDIGLPTYSNNLSTGQCIVRGRGQSIWYLPFKGTVSRDFLLLFFFLNQFPPSLWL